MSFPTQFSVAFLVVHLIPYLLSRLPLLQIHFEDVQRSFPVQHRATTQMRRQEHISTPEKWVASGKRLRIGDVQCSSADGFGVESLEQCVCMDGVTPADVDDDCVLVQMLKGRLVDDVFGVGGGR
jgi:hypothetical protein